MDSIGICIPTYNESGNLPVLVDRIRTHWPSAHVFVIDDNSPDGTADIAMRMARSNRRLHVIRRPCKAGLGSAYREGFKQVLSHPGIQLIAQMDADLSHPVRFLKPMIDAMPVADLVIGSRYISGAGIENWNRVRRLISRFGSWYARIWLGLHLSDLTGGYKIWRREMLSAVLETPLAGSGYVFQIEMTYRACCIGARIMEVPITFVERNAGKSKMSAGIVLEACWQVPRLRFANQNPSKESAHRS